MLVRASGRGRLLTDRAGGVAADARVRVEVFAAADEQDLFVLWDATDSRDHLL